MTQGAIWFRRTLDGSASVRALRTIGTESVIWWALRRVVAALWRVRRGVLAAGQTSWLSLEPDLALARVLIEDSRLARLATTSLSATLAAVRRAAATSVCFGAWRDDDASGRVRGIALVLLTALTTHTLVAPLIGLAVTSFGWGFRGLVAVLALLAWWAPQRVAAAWRGRRVGKA